MKTLFLHIGTPKTATSSIQKLCATNRDVLKEKSYCYPETIKHYPAIGINRNAHFMIGNIRDEQGKRDRTEEQRLFEQGMQRVHDSFSEHDNVILSDEGIWLASGNSRKNLWEDLIKDASANNYTIKIIVYLRRQDDFLSSRWNQIVKEGSSTQEWTKHFEAAPVKLASILDYKEKIDGMANLFGRENIIVRRFNRDSFYKGTIYDDFFQCIGLEVTDEFVIPAEDVNLALKGNTFEIMRVMNTTPALDRYNNMYWRKLVSSCSEESDKYYKYSMFSKEEAEEFLARYQEGNEQLATDYIGDGQPLFHYNVADAQKWEKDNPYMLDDVIRIFTVIASDLHEADTRSKQEEKQLKQDYKLLKQDYKLLKKECELLKQNYELLSKKHNELQKEVSRNTRRLDKLAKFIKHPVQYIFGSDK